MIIISHFKWRDTMPGDNDDNNDNNFWSGNAPPRPHLRRSLNTEHGDYASALNDAHARLSAAHERNEIGTNAFQQATRTLDQLVRHGGHLNSEGLNDFTNQLNHIINEAFNNPNTNAP